MYIIIAVMNGKAFIVPMDGTGVALVVGERVARAYVNAYADRGDFALAFPA